MILRAFRVVTAMAALALAGCASVPQATPERDAEARQFHAPHPGSAALYVYRPDTPGDQMVEALLNVDNRVIGAALAGSFFRLDLRPGKHRLHGSGLDTGALNLEMQAGEITFVSVTVISGHSRFKRVDSATGKREMERCCVLFENWAPGQRPLYR